MNKLKYADNEAVINAFLTLPKVKDVAEATGLSVRTVQRYKQDEDFQRVLYERKTEFVKTAVNKMQSVMVECVDVLMEIIRDDDTSPQTKVNAIKCMFDQARDWTASADVLERLKAIMEERNEYEN